MPFSASTEAAAEVKDFEWPAGSDADTLQSEAKADIHQRIANASVELDISGQSKWFIRRLQSLQTARSAHTEKEKLKASAEARGLTYHAPEEAALKTWEDKISRGLVDANAANTMLRERWRCEGENTVHNCKRAIDSYSLPYVPEAWEQVSESLSEQYKALKREGGTLTSEQRARRPSPTAECSDGIESESWINRDAVRRYQRLYFDHLRTEKKQEETLTQGTA